MYSTMKSPGKWLLEPVDVLERVVHLGVRHRARVEPARRGRRGCGASSSGRSGRRGWVGSARRCTAGAGSSGRTPKSRSSSSRLAVDVDARVLRVVGHPHRDRACPSSGFAMIDQSRAPSSHLPNWPSLTCSGIQVISWFSSTIRSRNSRDLDEPRATPPGRSADCGSASSAGTSARRFRDGAAPRR